MTTLKKLWQQPPQSYKRRLAVKDLAPDGVPISVLWDKFVPGTSVFVPCVNTVECGRQLNEIAKAHDWTIDMRTRIENKHWGIRVWRVL
jgi:hypothetical protein